MQVFRRVSIGSRLALGFGTILGLMALLLAGSSWQASRTRQHGFESLQLSQQRTELAATMRAELLQAAVAVRNMGLATDLDVVNKQEQSARAHRDAYGKARAALGPLLTSADETRSLNRLDQLDRQIEPLFKEALGVSLAFNTEVAAKIIGTQIDPLSDQLIQELSQLDAMQGKSASQAVTAAQEAAHSHDIWVMAASAATLLLAAGLGLALTRSITQPLAQAMEATGRLAKGDLVSDIAVEGADEPARLLLAIRDMRDGLATIVSGVREGTHGINHAAAEIASGNADLSSRTESQASALQQTASTMGQLSHTVKHNATLSGQAQDMASHAAETATAGQQAVDGVIKTMQAIEESSRRIVEINAVIDGIAFQTNILALNAAVEAARAGEQGRGFAVVASEVRALAQRTSGAAKEINALIKAAAERARDGSAIVDAAGQTMSAITSEVARVHAIVSEISQSSNQQAHSLNEVARAVTDIDGATQQNAALVEQAAAAAESMRDQSAKLTQVVSTFRL